MNTSGDSLYTVIAAIVGSLISGIILLLIHHMKVKQEIEKHRQIELFDRKQKVYRSILEEINQLFDFTERLGSDMNWRISRHAYNELILIGSASVITAFNNFVKQWDSASDVKSTELLKSVWIEVRKDLYKEKLLPEQMKIYGPSNKTFKAFEIFAKNASILKTLNLESYDLLSKMNVDEIHAKTGIPKEDLLSLKDMGIREADIEKSYKKFIKNDESSE